MNSSSAALSSFCILCNLISSICIVMLNKWIFVHYKFPSITLTCIHFIVTSLGLKICSTFNVFRPRSLEFQRMLPLSLTFCGFVVLTNLSLMYNTVGTYQLLKVLTTPCIMLIQYAFYKKSYTGGTILTLIPISTGVFLNCYYDIKFNFTGIVFALFGVFVTSVYQVWVGQTQKDLNVNAMQLLNYQAPLSAGVLVLVIPFFEPVFGAGGIFHLWPLHVWVLVLSSGIVAFSINLTIFWIIGNTSPVTYNMVGHLKFCLTLMIGYFLFHDILATRQIVGVLCTLSGVFVYSHLKLKESKPPASIQRNV